MKKMNSTSFVFKVWKNRKLKKVLLKEEEEEVQEDAQRDSEDVKDCNQCYSIVFFKMQVMVLLLQTLHVQSRKPLEEL